MSVGISFNSACRIPLATEFFMTRRPVLDPRLQPSLQELVFCSIDRHEESGAGAAEPAAGRPVIEDVCAHGLPRLLGDLPGILRVDEAALMSDAIALLPPSVVLGLPIRHPPGKALAARCAALAAAGHRFALAAGPEPAFEILLPLAAFVRIGIEGKDERALRAELARCRGPGRHLSAAQVDTWEQFRVCTALGFDSFQGNFFTVPEMAPGRKFTPSERTIAELLALLASDADDARIEHGIKADVRLGLNLLRLANSPAFTAHRVDSLRQALMALGRNQLQRWLQMLLYAGVDGGGAAVHALASLALTRGRLMELAARQLMPGNRGVADTAFTVGIMSLMDTLFGMSMEDILRQMRVVDEVQEALLDRRGFQGRLLNLAIEAESLRRPEQLLAAARGLQLSCDDLYLLQLAAYEWSDHAARSLHGTN